MFIKKELYINVQFKLIYTFFCFNDTEIQNKRTVQNMKANATSVRNNPSEI